MLVTRSALDHEHGRVMVARCEALGLEVERLRSDRLTGLKHDDPREAYRRAKSTLAIVVAPPSTMKLQPIAPSADWRIDLARGCPAHCQYCYLAGSLPGAPVTRAYANLDEILAASLEFEGRGTITSTSAARAHEGTTFEASCYTDPLGIEHLTGSLARTVEHFAARSRDGADVGLRFTTKFAAVDELVTLDHGGCTRARFSVNAAFVAKRFEGGAAPMPQRLEALGRMARAGYPVGLTIAPLMPFDGWHDGYDALLRDVAAVDGLDPVSLTIELIAHRFSDTSKQVLEGWYPASALEMDPEERTAKRTKFGAVKRVYPKATARELEDGLRAMVAEHLPGARILYFT